MEPCTPDPFSGITCIGAEKLCPPSAERAKAMKFPLLVKSVQLTYTLPENGEPGRVSTVIQGLSWRSVVLVRVVLASTGGLNVAPPSTDLATPIKYGPS